MAWSKNGWDPQTEIKKYLGLKTPLPSKSLDFDLSKISSLISKDLKLKSHKISLFVITPLYLSSRITYLDFFIIFFKSIKTHTLINIPWYILVRTTNYIFHPFNLGTRLPNHHHQTLINSKKRFHTLLFLRFFTFDQAPQTLKLTKDSIAKQNVVTDLDTLQKTQTTTPPHFHSSLLSNPPVTFF